MLASGRSCVAPPIGFTAGHELASKTRMWPLLLLAKPQLTKLSRLRPRGRARERQNPPCVSKYQYLLCPRPQGIARPTACQFVRQTWTRLHVHWCIANYERRGQFHQQASGGDCPSDLLPLCMCLSLVISMGNIGDVVCNARCNKANNHTRVWFLSASSLGSRVIKRLMSLCAG